MPQRNLGSPGNYTITLPSDGTRVWGPSELGFWEETQILSKAQRSEIDQRSQTNLTVIDNALFEYTLIHAWLEQGGWDLFDEDNQPIDVTTENIDRVFRGQQGRKDRTKVSMELVAKFFPEMLAAQQLPPGAPPELREAIEKANEGNADARRSSNSDETSSTSSLREFPSVEKPLQPTPS